MKVNVAGAGAGKTTMMADLITNTDIPEGKIVYCIAFTNAATENIKHKVVLKLGSIPKNIKISTIHSFLYQEIINPFHYFLYGKQFEKLSVINLPSNARLRQIKLSELEENNILHFTKIPEIAKWIVYKKSGDRKKTKDIRKNILQQFSDYCSAIYVDEAQDISSDIRLILEVFDKAGINIILYGDPKQDIKGLGHFKAIINNSDNVNYISKCHRCPQKHLVLSNSLASISEQQIADNKNAKGSIVIIFESDLESLKEFISHGNYGLQYISQKRDRFFTHKRQEKKEKFEAVRYEIFKAMADKWNALKSDLEINRVAFYITEQMMNSYNGNNESILISKWINNGAFGKLSKKQFAQIASNLHTEDTSEYDFPVVSSIESIKGLEAERCLFILSTDLAPYLFREKTEDNKISHLLYVALTRSSNHLTFLITKEVEEKYKRNNIVKFFSIIEQ